jgi:hypothetical protein
MMNENDPFIYHYAKIGKLLKIHSQNHILFKKKLLELYFIVFQWFSSKLRENSTFWVGITMKGKYFKFFKIIVNQSIIL